MHLANKLQLQLYLFTELPIPEDKEKIVSSSGQTTTPPCLHHTWCWFQHVLFLLNVKQASDKYHFHCLWFDTAGNQIHCNEKMKLSNQNACSFDYLAILLRFFFLIKVVMTS